VGSSPSIVAQVQRLCVGRCRPFVLVQVKLYALDTYHIKTLKVVKIWLKVSWKSVTCSSWFCADFSHVALYGHV
jgi:hypothetical protein